IPIERNLVARDHIVASNAGSERVVDQIVLDLTAGALRGFLKVLNEVGRIVCREADRHQLRCGRFPDCLSESPARINDYRSRVVCGNARFCHLREPSSFAPKVSPSFMSPDGLRTRWLGYRRDPPTMGRSLGNAGPLRMLLRSDPKHQRSLKSSMRVFRAIVNSPLDALHDNLRRPHTVCAFGGIDEFASYLRSSRCREFARPYRGADMIWRTSNRYRMVNRY